MKNQVFRAFFSVVAVLAMAAMVALSPRNVAQAQSSNSASAKGLEGTWRVQVTIHDCNTGAPLGPPFASLLSFARGGTITETTSRSSPAFRGPAHGVWSDNLLVLAHPLPNAHVIKLRVRLLYSAGDLHTLRLMGVQRDLMPPLCSGQRLRFGPKEAWVGDIMSI